MFPPSLFYHDMTSPQIVLLEIVKAPAGVHLRDTVSISVVHRQHFLTSYLGHLSLSHPQNNMMHLHSHLAALLHQSCIRAHGGMMQPCTMWCLEECEHAPHIPSIFSWFTALATLSRLLRDFNSGSAIFRRDPDPLSCLVPPAPPVPPSLYIPFSPSCLNFLSHTTHPTHHCLFFSLTLPNLSSITHTWTHKHCLRHSD